MIPINKFTTGEFLEPQTQNWKKNDWTVNLNKSAVETVCIDVVEWYFKIIYLYNKHHKYEECNNTL